ncbi:MAG TPA: serine hydrolase [Acetobacteraceae bacterium]|nr:serine hydrolase [Acetobacteraceae bacterium]
MRLKREPKSERHAREVRNASLADPIRCAGFAMSVVTATYAWHAASAAARIEDAVEAVRPQAEAYIAAGMQTFDLPGLAIGIVADDKLVYSRGFGTRSKNGPAVGPRTVFQIGSATKGFLAATQAIMVDRGRLKWDDRVIDLDPAFSMHDPWVTREFRVFDLLAQRSGLPPYANDALGIVGLDRAALIRSLRYVEPVSSFRTTFAYTNVTHIMAGRIVAKVAAAADWNAVLQKELLDPLGMHDTSYTAAAIETAPDHASGYRWAPTGTVEVPFTQIFPYDFDGAGDINSTVEDAARWLRLQLGHGTFEGRQIVSAANLAATHTPKVAISPTVTYALGWVVQQTPNGTIVWHNGGTSAFGSYFGLLPERNVGVVILTNEANVGLPDALGRWLMDRILGNPPVDVVAEVHKSALANFQRSVDLFARPDKPRPFPPLAPLAGSFVNQGIGKVVVTQEGDGLTMRLEATGARLTLTPWDGEVFTASVVPEGRFKAISEDLGPLPSAFVQFQIGKDGKLGVLHLSFDDGQAYDFTREQ